MGRKKVVPEENSQGEELQQEDQQQPKQPEENSQGGKQISEAIRAMFNKHPHVLTIWANEDQSEWYFRPKPGFTPIERNEL